MSGQTERYGAGSAAPAPAGDGAGSGAAGPAVVYFAKVPTPGQVKTRLCPPLTPAEAAGLYAGFLRDVVRPVPDARTLVYGFPADDLDGLAGLVPAGVELRPQVGDDLFARMAACFAELFAAGHTAVVLRNTDSPDLPRARVDEALAACASGRVVLGPDRGGGYYLVGLAAPAPALFAPVAVASQDVHAETVRRARAVGLDVVELAVEADVDTFDDLLALWRRRELER